MLGYCHNCCHCCRWGWWHHHWLGHTAAAHKRLHGPVAGKADDTVPAPVGSYWLLLTSRGDVHMSARLLWLCCSGVAATCTSLIDASSDNCSICQHGQPPPAAITAGGDPLLRLMTFFDPQLRLVWLNRVAAVLHAAVCGWGQCAGASAWRHDGVRGG